MRYFCICILCAAAILTCLLGTSDALDVTLAWDANTEPDLAGYAIHYGAESGGPYYGEGALEGDSPIDMRLDEDEDPDPDVVQFTLHDLPEEDYFFAVTASNAAGVKSGYSNEASTTDRQESTAHLGSTGGGGDGACFVSTAGCVPTGPTNEISLSLLLVFLSLCAASVVNELRQRRTMNVPMTRTVLSSHWSYRYPSVFEPA